MSAAHYAGPYDLDEEAAVSQYFDIGDRTLWNPSNGAARLFLRQAAVFEAELGLPSGVLVLAERAGVEVRCTPADGVQDDGLGDVQVSRPPAVPDSSADGTPGDRLRTKMRELDRFMAW